MSGFDYSSYPIHRPSGPPVQRKRRFAIWTTPPGDASMFRVLIPELLIVSTHYLREEKRTVFCGGDSGGCMCDHTANPARWTGYLLCELMNYSRAVVIWHVTQGCGASCPALTDKSRTLLNARVRAMRQGKSTRSPITAEVDYDFYRAGGKPREFDLLAYMIEVYSSPNNEVKRAKNQLPPNRREPEKRAY